MRTPFKNNDQVTRELLQMATVRKPSKEFVPGLMQMIEQERRIKQRTDEYKSIPESESWAVYTTPLICLFVFSVLLFVLIKDLSSTALLVQNATKTLTSVLEDYPRIFYSSLREYYLIPIVINSICILIVLDRFFRKRILRLI